MYRVPDRVPECTEYQSVTVDSFRLYPRVPVKNQIQNRIWRKSEQQVEIIHRVSNNMQKMEQMELELQTVKKIAKVNAMLEKSKEIDWTRRYMEQQNEFWESKPEYVC